MQIGNFGEREQVIHSPRPRVYKYPQPVRKVRGQKQQENIWVTMPTRRGFLKTASGTAAGIFFADCSCSASPLGFAMDQQQSAALPGTSRKRREVSVAGRRVKVIDVHAHVRVPEAWDLVKDRVRIEGRPGDAAQAAPDNAGNIHNDVEKRLADLDEMGVDVQAVSINPFWYWADVDLSRKIIQIQNEKIAEFCAGHSDRFVGLGSVALQHPALAIEQMEEGVKKFGMRGFAIAGSVNGCLLYTSPSPRDRQKSRMPSSA